MVPQSNFKFIHLIPRKFVHDTATLVVGALFMPCCCSTREGTLWPMFIVFAWGPQRPTSNCSLLSWQSKSSLGAPSKIPISTISTCVESIFPQPRPPLSHFSLLRPCGVFHLSTGPPVACDFGWNSFYVYRLNSPLLIEFRWFRECYHYFDFESFPINSVTSGFGFKNVEEFSHARYLHKFLFWRARSVPTIRFIPLIC